MTTKPSMFAPESSVAVLAPVLLRRTRPIYQLKRGRPESELAALGSGFFIRYLGRTVFITAGHVAREIVNAELFVPTVGTAIESIPGQFAYTRPSGGNPANDRIDLAFIEVPPAIADRLAADSVFTASDWETRDIAGPRSHYLVCGWPAKRNQPGYLTPHILPRRPISYRDICHPSGAYASLGIDPRTHYAIRFDPKRARDEARRMIQPPQLYGVSGGPVFFFHRYADALAPLTIPVPKLVGVAIEVHAKEKAIVVTRFALVLAVLERHFNGPVEPASPDTVIVRLP